MLSFNKRILFAGLLALSACGFEPVYGPDTKANALLGKVGVEVQSGRAQFEFRKKFQELLHIAPSGAPFQTSYTLSISESDIVISQAQGITRWSVSGTVEFDVVDTRTGETVLSGSTASNTAYNATAGTFQTGLLAQMRSCVLHRIWLTR